MEKIWTPDQWRFQHEPLTMAMFRIQCAWDGRLNIADMWAHVLAFWLRTIFIIYLSECDYFYTNFTSFCFEHLRQDRHVVQRHHYFAFIIVIVIVVAYILFQHYSSLVSQLWNMNHVDNKGTTIYEREMLLWNSQQNCFFFHFNKKVYCFFYGKILLISGW